jgi:arylsulfatase A-like enzyme
MRSPIRTALGIFVMLGGAIAALPMSAEAGDPPPQRPNVVFILADDIGYGDVSCYGAKLVQTPNIDRLASQGRRFTDVHTPASTCTPTRYGLMTGQYAWRNQAGSAILPGDAALSIAPGCQTLPGTFQRAGYTTGIVGKWHLGLGEKESGIDWNGDIKPGPLDCGFDYAYYFPATGDRVPCVFVEGRRVVGLDPSDPIKVSYKEKVGDDPTGREHPELLTLKPTHGHDQTIVNGISRIGYMSGGNTARWVDENLCDNLVKKGVEFIERNQGKPFFLYFATHDIHVPRVPHPRFRGKSQCGTRGDAIVELDSAVGDLMATLDRLHLADHTLVIFTSDNGGIMDDGYEDVGSFAHPCNGILRGHKGTLFEGGNRVPFIARYPGVIQAGAESAEMFALLDMEATFAALVGQKLDAAAAPDSFNALPALLGREHAEPIRGQLVMQNGGTQGPFAIRWGDWKLVQRGGAANKAGGYGPNGDIFAGIKDLAPGPLLFDLSKDVTESQNLAAANPLKVAELKALLTRLQEQSSTRP